MKKIAVLVFFMVLLCSTYAEQRQDDYSNPILQGFYPDPSICRVGDDFYMVNSTFSFYPGLPVFQSKDLVHWEQIGNALDRPEQLDLSGISVSGGIYAPTLRFHEGKYYIVCTVVGGINNFVISADSPAGPWSNPVALPFVDGMDPDLFFDNDGKAYITSCASPQKALYEGHRAIVMYEFDVDNLTTSEEGIVLVNGGADITKQPIWCEGPHLYKNDAYYYLLCAEGGTSIDHSVVVFRSKSLLEPFVSYANNPILTQRHLDPKRDNPVSNTGHADMVQLPSGEWWCVFLGCRPYSEKNHFNTGRETFLLPVRWEEEWPMILDENKKVPLTCAVPKLPQAINGDFPLNGSFEYVEHFDKEELPFYMLHIRTAKTPIYQCDSGLHLQLQSASLDDVACPSFVGRRQQQTNFETIVALDFSTDKKNETAGLVAFQNEEYYYSLVRTSVGFDLICGHSDGKKVLASRECDFEDSSCFLKMTGDDKQYHFYISDDNKEWEEVGTGYDASYLSTTEAGGFVGTIIGMYASSNGRISDNIARFDWMKYVGF